MLAEANKADLRSPWAIIIESAPQVPHKLFVIMPANEIPMCPTEE